MIQIQSVAIEHFRGIQKLQVEPGRQNFAIYGPNGTGKSGVVDALEFVITGGITRLTGEGTSDISLKSHAPHVDRKDDPEAAKVTLTAFIPALQKNVVIERCVQAPATPKITPADADVARIVSEIAQHPEFALTRREIIKYVLAAPAERSKGVQALLRLDRIDKVRQSLQTIVNACNTDAKRVTQSVTQAQGNLVRAFGIPILSKNGILEVVNQRRLLLQLDLLSDLGPDTSLKTGMGVGSDSPAAKSKIPKKQALADLGALWERLTEPEPTNVAESRAAVASILQRLVDSPVLLRSLKQEAFLRAGLDLIDVDESCPFCDNEWEVASLQAHVRAKLDQAKQASDLKKALDKAAEPLLAGLAAIRDLAVTAAGYGRQLPALTEEPLVRAMGSTARLPTTAVDVHVAALSAWASELQSRQGAVTNLNDLESAIADLSGDYRHAPESVTSAAAKIQAGIAPLPDVSKEDEAKEFLTVCQERLDAYREARRQQERCKQHTVLATQALEAYSKSSTAVLTKIYKDVEADFSRYYSQVNRDDEARFEGRLTPTPGKLGFDVDFYGRGFFPPGAYHSEGHQDAMGICLYLALMKHTLGPNFTFTVLDDVLTSVDTGHRREICGLLKTEFPNTQFVITTHDKIWFQQMKTDQLVTRKSSVEFRRWTVADGPAVWDSKEVWIDIANDLDNDNIADAAFNLRRYLESVANTLSDRFRANVEYRGDNQYDLGDLLHASIAAWKSILGKAQSAAQSWGKKEDTAALSERQQLFGQRVQQSSVEQWAINKNVHYNEWANFRKEDFVPVVEAFKNMLDCFRCPDCNNFFYVTPPPKAPMESVRCDCGSVNINLKKRT